MVSTKINKTQPRTPKRSASALPSSGSAPLSPWVEQRFPHSIALCIPMVLRKAPMVGFGSAMAGLPVWGANKRRIVKQRYGQGLGFRWPPINANNQQSTNIRRMCKGRFLVGGAWAGERVGGTPSHCLGLLFQQ